MKCRVCSSKNIKDHSLYRPYKDYKTYLYECQDCGCRFCSYDEGIHEKLHKTESGYSIHDNHASRALELFKEKKTEKLREHLSLLAKNKFIIDQISKCPKNVKILETGCSKGYLTSYFISCGYEILGTDISEEALEDARRNFGDHFCNIMSHKVKDQAPYDIIFHVGTVGCVSDPIGFMENLLSLLKPGGKIIFNAPNIEFCMETGFPWALTPPPDLVTVFPPDFWKKKFGDRTSVELEIVNFSKSRSVMWRCFTNFAQADVSENLLFNDNARGSEKLSSKLIRKVLVVFSIVYSFILPIKPVPDSVGVMVSMTKK